MKNTILLLFILFCHFNGSAQKYVFNTLVKYSTKMNNENDEKVTYTNSQNDSYFLRLKKSESSLSAILYDYKNLKMHEFRVIETKSKNEFFFKFEYLKSTKLNLEVKNKFEDYQFTFQNISSKDSIRKVKLNVYKNSKKKRSLMEYELEIKNYSRNLFPSFRISCIHPFEFIEKLNIHENGLVINAKGTVLSGKKASFKLLELKQLDFELEVKN